MSFRKRNAVISTSTSSQSAPPRTENAPIPGVRPSPLDGRPTTSTGTSSLDNLLAGHAGLPLGTSLLIGEHGTTDFAGVLLRYYAAEGMVQGHQIHILGLHEGWRHELPGISTDDKKSSSKSESPSDEKMKIAWRYESLAAGGAPRDRNALQRQASFANGSPSIFCHSFDLTKRLSPTDVKGQIGFHPSMAMPSLSPRTPDPSSPFKQFVKDIDYKLANSPPSWIHRVIVPSLLSPTSYSGSSARPEEVLQFLHALRALLRQYPSRLTAVITLPLSLYPRTTGLTRWMELLCDGVFELIPLQSNTIHAPPPSSKSDSKSDEQTQGLVKVHSLPIFHERGGGPAESNTAHGDLSFSLSRSKGLVIKPFYLPPVGEDAEEKKGESGKNGMDRGRDSSIQPLTTAAISNRPPVRISKVAGRYLLFDIDDIMYVRRSHNICSLFIGTIPQNPQQNVFMGLPIELMPEEVQVLLDKNVGFVVDDAAFHPAQLATLDETGRKRYLEAIKAEGRRAQAVMVEHKQNTSRKVTRNNKRESQVTEDNVSSQTDIPEQIDEGDDLFSPLADIPPSTPSKISKIEDLPGYAVTPTTSSLLPSSPFTSTTTLGQTTPVVVPPSYPLYAHLQDRGYFMLPGLRFGCDYNVYPGDPLRFHSHFQATSYGWDEPITVLDLVAGGRLGTNVKKGYLIGGAIVDGDRDKDEGANGAQRKDREGNTNGHDDLGTSLVKGKSINANPKAPPARAFCIEWAAM
ncbi:PAXNEB protein-domain-containing protein [Hypoxylon sp. NC1633]|nr:PAXNEB protein-domain-containing protein [Hypoxylon sp. NC1633]